MLLEQFAKLRHRRIRTVGQRLQRETGGDDRIRVDASTLRAEAYDPPHRTASFS